MHRPTFFWYNGAEYTLLENIMTIFEELKARGLIFQTTDEEALVKAFEEGPVSYYTGYDPTADSLHLGHLVAILTSRRLQLAGHKPYALVGGATGLIGDPSFKDAERSLQTKETVEGWVEKIQGQLSRFLDFENGDNKAVMVNNYDWFGSVSFIDFLRDVGKYFTVNYMMSKESVKKRIETGISYTEFAYQIMQGYDFYELNDKYGVTLQIGGSDQWGNMTAGTELLRRKADKSGHVITVPLITDSTGKKFGKSEGNAVWLDATKTTPYEMYQFWLNVMDDDAVRFLKIFTFLSLEEIEEIGKEFDQARHQRLAQKVLAREVVTLVHGKEAYEQVKTELATLNADIDLIESNIAQTELRAPFDGVIGLRQVSVGTYASPTTIVAKLTKISPLKVEFAVPERYANDVKTGAGLDFTLEGKLKTFHATVYARESKIDPTTHTLTIRALYPNANGAVLPGRYASIKLNKDEIQDALAVPSEAIVPEMGKDKIFLYKSGKAQPVEITTGIRTEAEVQVLQGLQAGDTIITSGTLQLRTGLPVTLDNIN